MKIEKKSHVNCSEWDESFEDEEDSGFMDSKTKEEIEKQIAKEKNWDNQENDW